MSEFKVGDWVVLNPYSGDYAKDNSDLFIVTGFEDLLENLAILEELKYKYEATSHVMHLKEATPEEIKVGRRL